MLAWERHSTVCPHGLIRTSMGLSQRRQSSSSSGWTEDTVLGMGVSVGVVLVMDASVNVVFEMGVSVGVVSEMGVVLRMCVSLIVVLTGSCSSCGLEGSSTVL